MSQPKPKLGSNPLVARGIGALFSESSENNAALNSAPAAEASGPNLTVVTDRRRVRKPIEKMAGATVGQLVETVRSTDDGTGDLTRHTFYLTDAQAKKIKLYALLHGMQISEVVRWLVDEHLDVTP